MAQPQAEDCGCRPVALTAADIAVWELSWPKASRVLREALGLAACRAELGLYDTRQIGLWLTGGSPVLLTVQTDPYDFQRTVEGLIARLRGGFILLSPTCGLVDVVSRSLLASANAGFFPLDTTVFFTEGGLVQPRQRPGELFSAFTPQPTAPTDEDTARKVYAVLSAFKTDPKFDRPTVMDVFESYCRGEGRSVAQVAHDYSCSRLTVLRRLKIIRAQTGRDPRDLRRYSSYFEKIREEMADSRAARIHRGTMDH